MVKQVSEAHLEAHQDDLAVQQMVVVMVLVLEDNLEHQILVVEVAVVLLRLVVLVAVMEVLEL